MKKKSLQDVIKKLKSNIPEQDRKRLEKEWDELDHEIGVNQIDVDEKLFDEFATTTLVGFDDEYNLKEDGRFHRITNNLNITILSEEILEEAISRVLYQNHETCKIIENKKRTELIVTSWSDISHVDSRKLIQLGTGDIISDRANKLSNYVVAISIIDTSIKDIVDGNKTSGAQYVSR